LPKDHLRLWLDGGTMLGVYPLSHLIVDERQADLLAASAHTPRPRRLPFGVLRGVRLVLRRAPRRAAAS
jgi:hypothetical protein